MKHIEEEQGNKDKIIQALTDALDLVGLDIYTFGAYLSEKVSEDRNINVVKREIVEMDDYYEKKEFLHQLEYIAAILTKTS
jgi:hypothetical protein